MAVVNGIWLGIRWKERQKGHSEADLERYCVKLAWYAMHVEGIKLNLRGNVGWPDREFFGNGGKPLLIEFKRPGEGLDPPQVIVIRNLRKRGYEVCVVESVSGFISALERYRRSQKVDAKATPRHRRRVRTDTRRRRTGT